MQLIVRPGTEPGGGEPDPASGSPRQRRTLVLFALLLTLVGLWTIRTFVPAVGWAAILAIAMSGLYGRVRQRFPPKGHDVLWPAIFTLGIALLFLVPLAIAGVEIAREARVVIGMVEEARKNGLPVPDWLSRLPLVGAAAGAWWTDNLANSAGASELIERLNHGTAREFTRSFGGQVVHRAVIFGFTILTLFFLFRDGKWLANELKVASYRAVGPQGERVGRQMVASVHGTIDGLVLVGLGEGVLIGISYWLAGVPHAILFGAATAVAATVPFGAPILFCSAALVVLANGSIIAAAAIVIFGFVVTFVADHAIRPALIGGATQLPFVWVLFGILGGVETFGLLGLFLGPALMAALHLLWRDWTAPVAAPPLIVAPDKTPAALSR